MMQEGFAHPGPTADAHQSGTTMVADLYHWLTGRLRLGAHHRIDDLTVHALLVQGPSGKPDLLLHQAQALDLLEIGERAGGAIVPEVDVFNRGAEPVLILEGDTLIGAKQNRVVARTVLVPAGKPMTVPVGCMERGRWAAQSRGFVPGTCRAEPALRRETVKEVVASRRRGGPGHLDQARLWMQVGSKLACEGVDSPTSDYQEVLLSHGRRAWKKAEEPPLEPGQIGILGMWRDLLLGVELVGHPETWSELARRSVPSFALAAEAAERYSEWRPISPRRTPEEWLGAIVTARVEVRPALGLGLDLELTGEDLVGAGLWHDDRPAHLAVFPDGGEGPDEEPVVRG